MAHYGYTRFLTALNSSSGSSSGYTSNPIWVGDASSLMVSQHTNGPAVGSVISIDASLGDGFQSTLVTTAAPNQDWFRLGSIATASNFTYITPGPRWLRFIRSATDSMASVLVAYRAS